MLRDIIANFSTLYTFVYIYIKLSHYTTSFFTLSPRQWWDESLWKVSTLPDIILSRKNNRTCKMYQMKHTFPKASTKDQIHWCCISVCKFWEGLLITGGGDRDEMAHSSLFNSLPCLQLLWYPHAIRREITHKASLARNIAKRRTKNALNHLFEDKMSLEMSRKGMLELLGEECAFITYKYFQKVKNERLFFLSTKTTVFPTDIPWANFFPPRISTWLDNVIL